MRKFLSGAWKRKAKDGETTLFAPVAKTYGLAVEPNKRKRDSKDPDFLIWMTFPSPKGAAGEAKKEPELKDDHFDWL